MEYFSVKPTIRLNENLLGECVHVLDSVADPASGPSYSVPRLCEALAAHGLAVRLMTIGNEQSLSLSYKHDAFPCDFGNFPVLKHMRFSRALKTSLQDAARAATVVHAHGLWLMSNVYPAGDSEADGNAFGRIATRHVGEAALSFSVRKKRYSGG